MSNKGHEFICVKHLGKIILAIIGGVWAVLVTVYKFYKDDLKIDLLAYFCKPGAIFPMLLLISIFGALSVYLFFKYLELKSQADSSAKKQEPTSDSTDNAGKKSDSIMEILVSAQPREVIKIGTALSDVLWTTSRKELRIKVGQEVRAAAKKLASDANNKDEKKEAKRIEARVMIEDIGNTTMCLNHKDVEAAIDYIKEGIKIAKNYDFSYESARGYRNLANCYALKEENEAATNALKEAEQAMAKIPDEREKAQIAFDISYAQSKIYRNTNHQEAINALRNCLELYDKLEAAAKPSYADRIVKIHREMGVIYLLMKTEQDSAIDAFEAGRKLASERQNHEDIVRCCTELIKLHTENYSPGLDKVIEDYINQAEKHIDKVDTTEHTQAFYKAKEAWETKRSVINNGTK